MRHFLAASLALAFFMSAWAQPGHWYDPEQPGHGIVVSAVTDSTYVAQWYAHDGREARWFASDVCDYSDVCPVFVIESQGFPAKRAKLVEAGEILLLNNRGRLTLVYDLSIDQIGCWQLPGPLPPQCRDATGAPDTSKVFRRGFHQSGELSLTLLLE